MSVNPKKTPNSGKVNFKFSKALQLEPVAPIPVFQEVFDMLPEPLLTVADKLPSEIEKDIFLTSSLAVFSSILPSVKFEYDGKIFCTNLYTVVIAPPASGKWAVQHAGEYVDRVHSEIQELNLSLPVNSVDFNTLFLPGDISAAAITKALHSNKKGVLILESEADSVSKNLKNEWGGLSDVLRKCFQHERVSVARKKERYEIDKPRLSMALGGTPDQLYPLMHGVENGLFSRCLFYYTDSYSKWRPITAGGDKLKSQEIRNQMRLSGLELYKFFINREVTVRLSRQQQAQLNRLFANWNDLICDKISLDLSGSVKRMGIICIRISAILAAIRYQQTNNASKEIKISRNDLEIALHLSKKYLESAILVYRKFKNEIVVEKSNMDRVLHAIPKDKEVMMSEIYKLCKSNGLLIKPRTIRNLVLDLIRENKVKRVGPKGPYIKL